MYVPEPKRKKVKKELEPWQESPETSPVDDVPEKSLSFAEKKALVEAFSLLPKRLLPGVMQIVREADFVNVDDDDDDDDDKIDLDIDIDDLDTKIQRKLQSFVMEVRLTNDLLDIVI